MIPKQKFESIHATDLVHPETNPRILFCDPTLVVLRHSYRILPVHSIGPMYRVGEKGKCRQSVSVEEVNLIEAVRRSEYLESDRVEVDSVVLELYLAVILSPVVLD